MAKLSKDLIKDAVFMIRDFESPETFYDKNKLAKAIEGHFDCEVDPEDVVEFVREYDIDEIDRYLILKNILQ